MKLPSGWRKIYSSSVTTKYKNLKGNILKVQKKESMYYGNRWEVKFNRYVISIFKSRTKAYSYANKWMKHYGGNY